MTLKYAHGPNGPVVTFDDVYQALRFVLEWRFGYAGRNSYDLELYTRWGLPRPSSAPDHMDLDKAIEEGLRAALSPGPPTTEQLYYVRCTEAYGDVMLWWGPDRCGYTTNLEDAGLYSEADAREICRVRPPIEIAYRREDVEREAVRFIPARRNIAAMQWETP